VKSTDLSPKSKPNGDAISHKRSI